MKRLLVLALLIGSSTVGFVGCDQTTKTEDTIKSTGPGGTETKKIIVEDKKTGDAKEPNPVTPPATDATKP